MHHTSSFLCSKEAGRTLSLERHHLGLTRIVGNHREETNLVKAARHRLAQSWARSG